MCERLHRAVQRVVGSFDLKDLGVNASIGAIILDTNLPDEPESLLALADREMYAVKCSETEKIRISPLSMLRGSLYEIAG